MCICVCVCACVCLFVRVFGCVLMRVSAHVYVRERKRKREREIERERGQCFDLKMNNTFSLMEGRKNEIPAKKRQDVTTTAPTTATTISRFNS